jgi:hypothetical protein
MSTQQNGGQIYVCPMHKDVRRPSPGVCTHCGMALIPEGARFGMLQHMLSSPRPMMVMAAVMIALMAAVMMMLK